MHWYCTLQFVSLVLLDLEITKLVNHVNCNLRIYVSHQNTVQNNGQKINWINQVEVCLL
jgi:hypothetical protein